MNAIPESYKGAALAKVWTYHSPEGEALAAVARYDRTEGGKDVIPFRPNGQGWQMGALPEPRPLFGLDRLATMEAQTVFLVEGEKTAAAAHGLDMPAVTWQGGCKATSKADWEPLSGRKAVYLLPDNDNPGTDAMKAAAAQLATLEDPPALYLVELQGLPEAGDLCDWIAARVPGWDELSPVLEDHREALRDELREAITQHRREVPPEWTNPAPSAEWPEPEPIPEGLPSVPPFDAELLPESLRPWIMDIAERMQCPPDFPAAAAVVALASVVGRSVGIRPKLRDDWTVAPNLWGGIVGRPSLMKSPALAEATNPLGRLEAEENKRTEKEGAESRIEATLAGAQIKGLKKKADQAAEKGNIADAREMLERAAALEEERPEVPRGRVYKTNDATVEKLGEVLAENPRGVLLLRDELTGWLRSLDREGAENARPFFLEAWSGTAGAYRTDRIGRGTIVIENPCVSVLGGIQPGPLYDYIRGAMAGGRDADGLLQRFQVLVWPEDPGPWKNVDRYPDTAAKDRAFEVFERLAALDPDAIGAAREEWAPMPFLRFDPAAQELFNEWRHDLENKRLKDAGSEALESALAKHRKLVPALALVFHLADCPEGGPVSGAALLRSCAWGEYLEGHARRLYALASDNGATSARALAAKLKAGAVPFKEPPEPGRHAGVFALRDVYLKGWRNLSREETTEAAAMLEELGWLAIQRKKTGGRPSVAYMVNPALGGSSHVS